MKSPSVRGNTLTETELFSTVGPGEEHKTNKPSPTGRVRERLEGDTTCPTTSQNPSLRHPSWLNKACTTSKDSESEWLAKDNPETNPITIKPETENHMAEQSFWVPWPYCSLPGHLFPIKSLALSAHVSPWTIDFWVLDKEPAFGPWKGSCFLQHQEACAGELRHSLKFYFLTLKQLMLIS